MHGYAITFQKQRTAEMIQWQKHDWDAQIYHKAINIKTRRTREGGLLLILSYFHLENIFPSLTLQGYVM